MKVQIKSIEIKQFEKEGKRYEMAFLEYGDQKVSMYLHPTYGAKDKEKIQQWAPGMEVDIIVYQSNGYTNFKIPTKTDFIDERLTNLESKFIGMYKQLLSRGVLLPSESVTPQQTVQNIQPAQQMVAQQPTPEEQLNIADQIDF